MALINPQEDFWKSKINLSYAQDNSRFDIDLGISAWKRMLHRVDSLEIKSYLDCGANIGRNIGFLNEILPLASSSIIEIALEPFEECKRRYKIDNSFLEGQATPYFNFTPSWVTAPVAIPHDDVMEMAPKVACNFIPQHFIPPPQYLLHCNFRI